MTFPQKSSIIFQETGVIQHKMAQNEEHSALYEVEIRSHIYYNNGFFESSSKSKGKNIFELAKDNPANMEVVKLIKGILTCFSVYNETIG